MVFTSNNCVPPEGLNVVLGTLSMRSIFETSGAASYGASNTDNSVCMLVSLHSELVLSYSECASGGNFGGDTYLRLFEQRDEEVTLSDDTYVPSSQLTFTTLTNGTYNLTTGCHSNRSCKWNMAWSVH